MYSGDQKSCHFNAWNDPYEATRLVISTVHKTVMLILKNAVSICFVKYLCEKAATTLP